MENLVKRMENRGWGKRDIIKTLRIIKDAKHKKPSDILFLEKRMFWILLIVVISANFAISIALIPILMTIRGAALYLLIAILGIFFGLLFENVIRSIEHLERSHHVFLAFLIPTTALANLFVISNISNSFMTKLGLSNFHNSIIVGLAYAASFVMPYIIYRFILKIEYYIKE